jgi:hypothetical protein
MPAVVAPRRRTKMLEHYRRKLVQHDEEPTLAAVPIAATRLTKENVEAIVEMTEGTRVEEQDPFDSNKTFVAVNVPTPTGMKRLSEGMYLLVDGEDFFVSRPGRFEALYEKV